MIYLWIYFSLGIVFMAWLVYWSIKYDNETFYVSDLWKLALTYIAWPVAAIIWTWIALDEKYHLNRHLKKIGAKKIF